MPQEEVTQHQTENPDKQSTENNSSLTPPLSYIEDARKTLATGDARGALHILVF